jgi:hypothetical protein
MDGIRAAESILNACGDNGRNLWALFVEDAEALLPKLGVVETTIDRWFEVVRGNGVVEEKDI